MLPTSLVIGVSIGYLLVLFGIASYGDARARAGRSIIGNAWVYSLSLAVYCTAWTYFGSVGRAASAGIWFLPIYLGPTLAMMMAWLILRKMIRIAKTYRITSIADFIASRYGKSPVLAGLVTIMTVVGILPYIALQLKAIASGFDLMTMPLATRATVVSSPWLADTLWFALALAGFTIVFGTRQLDSSERHEGMVAAIAFESVVKLIAFVAVGCFVTWGLFNGPVDLFQQAADHPEVKAMIGAQTGQSFAWGQWFALIVLSMLSVIFLPRQFQVMVVENVDEQHVRRAAWVFPLYLLVINLFVLPIALGGLAHFGADRMDPEGFVLSLPLANNAPVLALIAFVGGLSAATGMIIVETIAVSTMICNDLAIPLLLRLRLTATGLPRSGIATDDDFGRLVLRIRRTAIVAILVLGYLYFRIAGEAYALVSIGLISFAAVAQFAPALLGGMYWRRATHAGALGGLLTGFALWIYTLLLPSFARSGWLAGQFVDQGPFGLAWLRPEALFGLNMFDNLTHSLIWSLLANGFMFVALSLLRAPSALETSQALMFVDIFSRQDSATGSAPVFWRGRARLDDLRSLLVRFLGAARAERVLAEHQRRVVGEAVEPIAAQARLVQQVETELTGAIGSASARVVVASVVEEDSLSRADVLGMVEEASQLRDYSRQLEEKSRSLQRATEELAAANGQLADLDRLKDEFIASVTHELRTPLTSIRAFAELMLDDPELGAEQRQQFLGIMVTETERLTRLVNQVLDMSKIDSGAGDWNDQPIDLKAVVEDAMRSTRELFQAQGAQVLLDTNGTDFSLTADRDRLTQVILNLLSNAAKFLPDQRGRVQISLHEDSHAITVEVRDNGPGVPEAQREQIFERFRQGGDIASRPSGTGLGLSISRRIVAHYGGRIWLQPADGSGACFAFTLPRQSAADSAGP